MGAVLYLYPLVRHGNALVSTQIPSQLRDVPSKEIFEEYLSVTLEKFFKEIF